MHRSSLNSLQSFYPLPRLLAFDESQEKRNLSQFFEAAKKSSMLSKEKMAAKLKILFISAEVTPFAKAGGLADVCGSLPKALRDLGHDVRIAMPAYQSIEDAHASGKWSLKTAFDEIFVPVGAAWLPAGVFEGILPGSDVPVYFIAERNLLGRPKIYGYDDDPYRFCFFSQACLQLAWNLKWRPDVVHAHDWHAAPALTWLATTGQATERFRGIPTIFTIHNLAHQGRSSRNLLNYLGVMADRMYEENAGEVNFMARGIYHSTMITTVSPTYAHEILTPHGGSDLARLLQFRHYDLHGILNGLDVDIWNPSTDPNLAQVFGIEDRDKRVDNKLALQSRMGLPVDADIPLLCMVTRLDRQKGLDITGPALDLLLKGAAGDAQVIILGSGARQYESMLMALSTFYPQKMVAHFGYAPDLAPLIYGGSDIFLMPSLFEPCGLSQMIAMRYGCIPLVRSTGGLADTVRDGWTGFVFYDFSAEDFWHAISRALYVYRTDPDDWRRIQAEGMKTDFSWKRSAYQYQQVYEWAVTRLHGP